VAILMEMVPYRELCRFAALADVSVACMRGVLQGADCTKHRSRARARAWLERNRLLYTIAVPTEALLDDLQARRPEEPK